MLHPAPKTVAVIGLGSGDTVFSVGGRDGIETIACVEIVESTLHALQALQLRRPYQALGSLLGDERIRFIFGDGRIFLGSNTQKYDVIEADALRPNSAFAGNLYSYEYFSLLKSRLNPGGLAVTWTPTGRVTETFVKTFRFVYRFDSILVGSADPTPLDRDAIRARVKSSFTRDYFAKAGIDVDALVLPYLEKETKDLEIDRRWLSLYDINTDLFPKDEYSW